MSKASAARIARKTYRREEIVDTLQQATAWHASAFVALVGATELVPPMAHHTPEQHARFRDETRRIAGQIAELADELSHTIATHLGIVGSS